MLAHTKKKVSRYEDTVCWLIFDGGSKQVLSHLFFCSHMPLAQKHLRWYILGLEEPKLSLESSVSDNYQQENEHGHKVSVSPLC